MDRQMRMIHQRFLADILNNHIRNKFHTEKNIQWIMAASAIFLTFGIRAEEPGAGHVVLMVSSALSFLICLYAFEPFFSGCSHRGTDLMYYKSWSCMGVGRYSSELLKIDDSEKVARQYALDLLNLVKRQLIPKNRCLKAATWVLLIGVSGGLALILLDMLL